MAARRARNTVGRRWADAEIEAAREVWISTGSENVRPFYERSRRELDLQLAAVPWARREAARLARQLAARAQHLRAGIGDSALQMGDTAIRLLVEASTSLSQAASALTAHSTVCRARSDDLEARVGRRLRRRARGASSRQALFVRELLARHPAIGSNVDDWLALDDQLHFLKDQRAGHGVARRRAMTKLLQRAQKPRESS